MQARTIKTGVIVLAIAAVGFYAAQWKTGHELHEAEEKLATVEANLLGYTRFLDYVVLTRQKLSEKSRFLAASVEREETHVRHITADRLLFTNNSVVLVSYYTEYSYGYDLSSGKYDIAATPRGIEIRVGRPILVAAPAIKKQSYVAPVKGWFINEAEAATRIYEDLPRVVAESGKKLASDPAVMALCEKKLIAFMTDFLARQPGVKSIPTISVVYKT